MRCPERFAQRRTKLCTNQLYNIFEAQCNATNTSGDRRVLKIFLIRAHRKICLSDNTQNRTLPSSNRYLACIRVYKILL